MTAWPTNLSYFLVNLVISCRVIISFSFSAPSAPRDVTARLVAPLKVEVRWRSPAVTNGDISHYNVYAIPLRSTVSNSTLQTLQMVAIIPVTFMHGHSNSNGIVLHTRRNHGASRGWCPPLFSVSCIMLTY